MMKPIVLIELNEVPNSVLDTYARQSGFMRAWLTASDRYTTLAADRIQLDPWIAWPSFHRGVNDEMHGLLHLGQATTSADRFPPIWRILNENGVSVGVYGSLFSNTEPDLSPYAFFVPDVFSPHGRVKPADLAAFQDFNLRMTRASGRNVAEAVCGGGTTAVVELALRRRIRPTTLSRAAHQMIAERMDRKRLSRRRNLQTELHADIFCSLLSECQPKFATFYTNNVAAAMHRFWAASLPAGSIDRQGLDGAWLNCYSAEVAVALRSVERLLRLLASGRCGDVTVVLASAIGQEEIAAENHRGFLSVTDPRRFVEAVAEVDSDQYELLPTMVPDFTIRFRESSEASAFFSVVASIKIGGMRAVVTQERMRSSVVVGDSRLAHIRHDYADGDFKHSFTVCRSDDHTVHVSLQVDDFVGEPKAKLVGRTHMFDDLGLGIVCHDEGVNCTAQHCAEGSLIVHRGAGHTSASRCISSLDFMPSVLEYFGVALPGYLQGEPRVVLR